VKEVAGAWNVDDDTPLRVFMRKKLPIFHAPSPPTRPYPSGARSPRDQLPRYRPSNPHRPLRPLVRNVDNDDAAPAPPAPALLSSPHHPRPLRRQRPRHEHTTTTIHHQLPPPTARMLQTPASPRSARNGAPSTTPC
jgi:hypothetical protein